MPQYFSLSEQLLGLQYSQSSSQTSIQCCLRSSASHCRSSEAKRQSIDDNRTESDYERAKGGLRDVIAKLEADEESINDSEFL